MVMSTGTDDRGAGKGVVLYERLVILNKVLAVPDKRFKSGYRSKEVVGTAQALLSEETEGTQLYLDHIHETGKQFTKTQATSNVQFSLETREQRL